MGLTLFRRRLSVVWRGCVDVLCGIARSDRCDDLTCLHCWCEPAGHVGRKIWRSVPDVGSESWTRPGRPWGKRRKIGCKKRNLRPTFEWIASLEISALCNMENSHQLTFGGHHVQVVTLNDGLLQGQLQSCGCLLHRLWHLPAGKTTQFTSRTS